MSEKGEYLEAWPLEGLSLLTVNSLLFLWQAPKSGPGFRHYAVVRLYPSCFLHFLCSCKENRSKRKHAFYEEFLSAFSWIKSHPKLRVLRASFLNLEAFGRIFWAKGILLRSFFALRFDFGTRSLKMRLEQNSVLTALGGEFILFSIEDVTGEKES